MKQNQLSLKDIKNKKTKKKLKRDKEVVLLKPFQGSKFKKKRVGRGEGSGLGKTSGRGQKGQKSRTGYSKKIGFEGGQMPLYKRIPKRGFHNPFKKEYQIINLFMIEKKELKGDITLDELLKVGLIKNKNLPVKILGFGDISNTVNVEVHAISKSAKEKIEAKGGKVEIIKL
ncbi:MAG: 50S ribosomal protein L15 [Leptonema sp. (in: bacteria)]